MSSTRSVRWDIVQGRAAEGAIQNYLFGRFVPSHRRYTVAYEAPGGVITGEWHNNRMETDLAAIDLEE